MAEVALGDAPPVADDLSPGSLRVHRYVTEGEVEGDIDHTQQVQSHIRVEDDCKPTLGLFRVDECEP